jgi:hypothetical protein
MKSRFLLLLLLGFASVLLAGCASSTDHPTSPASPAATESPSPIAAPTDEASLVTGTSTPAPVVLIKNAALGTYLAESDGQVTLANAGTDWSIEDYQGSKRIYNAATGNYIAIENLLDHVEAIPIEPEWMSPRWTFAGDPSSEPITIRNVWHNWEVLYADADTGVLMYGRPPADAAVSQWLVEAVDGSAIAVPTPLAAATLSTPTGPLAERGALVPWQEYEAEAGRTNAETLEPDRTFGTVASESSGRRAVQLNDAGDYVEFTSTAAANSIVLRYVIPDADSGGGIDATISLYVNGTFRQKIALTSKYAWSYGGETGTFNEPAALGAHHFYDEARALIADIPAGATVRLQKDADDGAEYYVIDLVDLEQVAPPLTQPDGTLSLTEDCGAVPDDGADDGPALQACIEMASAAESAVWAPPGTFEITSDAIQVNEVSIQGAGMWYTVFHGPYARFECTGNHCHYTDFAILGETVLRDDESPENAFNGGAGSGSSLARIWVEHTKVGFWVGPGTTDGLSISSSRFRNLFADGVNFNSGTTNSIVENSHFRNTGDDALASWSQGSAPRANANNVFRFNTVQLPWRANCFAIYGGSDNKIEDNLCYDVVTYPGILIAQDFDAMPFGGTTTIERNSLIRAGGSMFRIDHGALKIRAFQGPISGVVIRDLLIEDATFTGIELDGPNPITAAVFENVRITGTGTSGILIRSNVTGDATFQQVIIENAGTEALTNYAASSLFDLILEAGSELK